MAHRTPYDKLYGTGYDDHPERVRKESNRSKRAREVTSGISLGSRQLMVTSRVQALYKHVTQAVIQPSQANGQVFARGSSQDKSDDTFSVDNNKVA